MEALRGEASGPLVVAQSMRSPSSIIKTLILCKTCSNYFIILLHVAARERDRGESQEIVEGGCRDRRERRGRRSGPCHTLDNS